MLRLSLLVSFFFGNNIEYPIILRKARNFSRVETFKALSAQCGDLQSETDAADI
jgi:hypothetical protein